MPFNTTVVLMPKILHLGIGCRRNTPLEKIENFVLAEMEKHGFDMRCVKSIASVDLKKDNVCERSAVLASGGCLKLRKTAHDGVTLAVAEEPLIIDF